MKRSANPARPDEDDNVIALPILGDWVSTESTIDPDTGERSDPFETVRPVAPK